MKSKKTYYILAVKHQNGNIEYFDDAALRTSLYDVTWYDDSFSAEFALRNALYNIKHYEETNSEYISEQHREIAHCTQYLATHNVSDTGEQVIRNNASLTRFRNRLNTANKNLNSINAAISDMKKLEDETKYAKVYELISAYTEKNGKAVSTIEIGNEVVKETLQEKDESKCQTKKN